MSTAKDVTDASFQADVLDSEKLVLVDFWAEWCGPCRAVSPILDQIAAEHSDKIELVKVNVDDNMQIAAKYQITSIPAMKLFKGGVHITGRRSPMSLYSEKVVTFEDDAGAYDQRDAEGFIKLNALRLRLLGRRDR